MQRRIDQLEKRNAELEDRVHGVAKAAQVTAQTTASIAKNVAKFGRRADLALAAAVWCSEGQKLAGDRQASRE
eukprot:15439110-Alexandrium_andersonii.AAC.1